MREAVGGTWLLYFFFIFIFVYVAFIAVIMNYASAYRTNNYIISYVENMEGNVDFNTVKNDVKTKFDYMDDIGFCCTQSSSEGVVYQVQTYITFDIPLLGFDIRIPITNDSKTVYGGLCDNSNVCR